MADRRGTDVNDIYLTVIQNLFKVQSGRLIPIRGSQLFRPLHVWIDDPFQPQRGPVDPLIGIPVQAGRISCANHCDGQNICCLFHRLNSFRLFESSFDDIIMVWERPTIKRLSDKDSLQNCYLFTLVI